MKKLWVVIRTTKPLPPTYKYFVRSENIGGAHWWGREKFGKGVSFKTREPDAMERQLAMAHEVHEV
jgi:hypothetical protein